MRVTRRITSFGCSIRGSGFSSTRIFVDLGSSMRACAPRWLSPVQGANQRGCADSGYRFSFSAAARSGPRMAGLSSPAPPPAAAASACSRSGDPPSPEAARQSRDASRGAPLVGERQPAHPPFPTRLSTSCRIRATSSRRSPPSLRESLIRMSSVFSGRSMKRACALWLPDRNGVQARQPRRSLPESRRNGQFVALFQALRLRWVPSDKTSALKISWSQGPSIRFSGSLMPRFFSRRRAFFAT